MNFNSIGARFGLIVGLVMTVLVGALFTAYISSSKESVIESEIHAARNLILMAESVRQNMEQKWDLGLFSPETLKNIEYKTQEERKAKILATVPVVAAWESAKAKAKEGGFEFKTPRRGARNKNNEPDAVEGEALDFFAKNPNAKDHYVIDEKIN